MTLLDIVTVPEKILREISAPVKEINGETQTLLDNMLETMYEAPGIGLAAVQIAVLERIVAVSYTHLTLPTTSRV